MLFSNKAFVCFPGWEFLSFQTWVSGPKYLGGTTWMFLIKITKSERALVKHSVRFCSQESETWRPSSAEGQAPKEEAWPVSSGLGHYIQLDIMEGEGLRKAKWCLITIASNAHPRLHNLTVAPSTWTRPSSVPLPHLSHVWLSVVVSLHFESWGWSCGRWGF